MKKIKLIQTTALVAAASLTLAYAQDETRQDTETTDKPTETRTDDENMRDYSGYLDSGFFVGTAVLNMQNESIGDVDRVIIDSATGKVRYVVLSIGGFLGIGDHHTAVPWNRLQFVTKREEGDRDNTGEYGSDAEVRIDATKAQLEKAPKFDTEKRDMDYTDEDSDPTFLYWDEEKTTPRDEKELRVTGSDPVTSN